MSDDTERAIIGIIADAYGVEDEELKPETRLEDIGDSLDKINFAINIENDFHIEISDEDIDAIITVGDAISRVKSGVGHV